MAKIYAGMATVLLSTVLCLALGEFYFRISYVPRFLGRDLDQAVFVRDLDFSPPLNEFGFRERSLPKDAYAERSLRLLFLGDSFTFGHGVKDGDKRFTRLVETYFAEDPAFAGRHIYTYNAGVSGTEPTRWVGYLDELAPIVRPQIVVAVFFLRDGTALCTSLTCYRAIIHDILSKYEFAQPLFFSALVRSAVDILATRDFMEYYDGMLKKSYLGDERQTERWRREQASILTLVDRSRAIGADFVLVTFPLLIDLDRYAFDDVESEVKRFAAMHQIQTIALLPGFRGRVASDLWVNTADQHPNELGNRIAAATLYPPLATLVRERLANSQSPVPIGPR